MDIVFFYYLIKMSRLFLGDFSFLLLVEDENYNKVKEKTKVSPRTIQSVYYWLNERDEAYKKLMLRYLKKIEKNKRQIRYYESMSDKYPSVQINEKSTGIYNFLLGKNSLLIRVIVFR